MKKQKWNTNASMPRKRFTTSNIIIYSIIAVVILMLCIFVGGAMDIASVNGTVDLSLMSRGFRIVSRNPFLLLKKIAEKNSFVCKMLFFGAFVIGIAALYMYSLEPKRLHRRGVEHGSARWGTPKDAKRILDPEPAQQHVMVDPETGERLTDIDGNFVCYLQDKNSILSSELKMSLTPYKLAVDAEKRLNLNLNVIVIGTPGSGKTRYVVLPNACQLNTSFVFTDPKGEIKRETAQMFLEAGYKVKTFNLIDMIHSSNYNPFEYVFDDNGAVVPEKVMMMTKILFNATKGEGEKDDFWSKKGEQTLQSMVFLVYEQSEYDLPLLEDGSPDYSKRDHSLLNFSSIGDKMRNLQYPPKGGKKEDGFFLTQNEGESDEAFQKRLNESFLCPLDKEFMELHKRKPKALAYKLYKEIRNAPEETGQSFLSSANVKTFPFNFPAVQDLTCCDNIQLQTLGDEKTVLYIITSATTDTFDFLTTMMYSQLFDTLSGRANFRYGGSLPVHVRFIMDEFANLAEIPNFERVITYVRSMNMSIVVILQMLTQLKTRYEKSFETITGACSATIFLGGAEESTIKSISERLGKETIDIRGYNKTKGKSPSTSENNSIVGRELMQPDELATMPSSDCVVMIAGLPPFYCKKYDLESHPNYRFLGLADKKRKYNHMDEKTVTLAEYQAQQREKKQAAIEAARKKHASVKLAKESDTSEDNQRKAIGNAFRFVDLLSVLNNPPKLKIEDKFANVPEGEEEAVFGDPLAMPVDFDPDLLYPEVYRKEKVHHADDTPTVEEIVEIRPASIPVPENIIIRNTDMIIPVSEKTDPELMGEQKSEEIPEVSDTSGQAASMKIESKHEVPDMEVQETKVEKTLMSNIAESVVADEYDDPDAGMLDVDQVLFF